MVTKNDRISYNSPTTNKPENSKIASLKGVQVTIWNTHYFAWCVVNNSVRTNRQMASQYLYLPWICLAGRWAGIIRADDRYRDRAVTGGGVLLGSYPPHHCSEYMVIISSMQYVLFSILRLWYRKWISSWTSCRICGINNPHGRP